MDAAASLLAQYAFCGTSNEAKTKRAELIKKHFKATSRTEIEKLMPLHDLEANFDALHRELTGQPSRYGVQDAPAVVNYEIPTFDFPGDKPRIRVAADIACVSAPGDTRETRLRR
jgi:alkyl sulfatase BDS1-like metallo-beta-lactamase superfamily hydrolase